MAKPCDFAPLFAHEESATWTSKDVTAIKLVIAVATTGILAATEIRARRYGLASMSVAASVIMMPATTAVTLALPPANGSQSRGLAWSS